MTFFFSVGLFTVEKFRLLKTFGFEETPLIHGRKNRRTEEQKDTWGLEIGD
jgi:hypothetical protein